MPVFNSALFRDLLAGKILSMRSIERFVFQGEICPTTKRFHYQGWFSFKKDDKQRPLGYMTETWCMDMSLKSQKAKADWQAYQYCVKDETCVPGTRKANFDIEEPPRKVVSDLAGIDLFWWQREILDLYNEVPDKRKVYWYWEPTGAVGKSSFVRHMKIIHPRRVWSCSGNAADIKYGFINRHKQWGDVKMVFLNLCRCAEGHISYNAIESLKDGDLFSTKYESEDLVFERPHVVVFANIPPDESKMSADRWDIRRVDDQAWLNDLFF